MNYKIAIMLLLLAGTIELTYADQATPIVFTSRNHLDTLNGIDVGPPVEILGREKIVGGGLKVLYPDGRVVDLTSNTPIIDVSRPMVSFDGKKVVFSGVKSPKEQWHIYEINVDGSGFRQITFDDRAINIPDDPRNPGLNKRLFGRYGDFSPAYLPDGRIVFASTRYPSLSASCGQRALNLYVMNSDDSGMHRITTERAGAIDPYVMKNGRVLFSHWVDNMNMPALAGPGMQPLIADKNFAPSFWILWATNPDGSDAGRHAFNGGKLVDKGGAFQAREMPDGRIVYTYRTQGSLLGSTLTTGIAILTPGAGEGNSVRGIGDPANLEAPHALSPAPLPDGWILFSYTPNATVETDSSGRRTAKYNYGLYITDDKFEKLTLLYDDPQKDELDAVAVYPRTAQILADLPDAALITDDQDLKTTATLINSNIYADLPLEFKENLAPKPGTVVAIDFYDDSQSFTTSEEFPLVRKQMPRFIGSVPVNPDGSFAAKVPADIPFFWVLRSQSGVVSRFPNSPAAPGDAGQVTTNAFIGHDYFRPGQVAACIGCHRGHMIRQDITAKAQTNLARLAVASASSALDNFYHSAARVDDNRLSDSKDRYEWASKGEPEPWVQLAWPMEVTATEIVLYPRIRGGNQVSEGTLYFSDGSSLAVLLADGFPAMISFPPKNIKWVRFSVDKGIGRSLGLAEMVVHGSAAVEMPSAPPSSPAGLTATQGVLYLAWNRSPEINLGGYKVYYGTSHGQYTSVLDVGNVNKFLISGLSSTTYYIALKAYNIAGAESDFSNEVSATAVAPVIESVAPASGPAYGGTKVTITGRNFAPRNVRVLIGGAHAYSVAVLNSTTITATTKHHKAGSADVEVVNPDEQRAVLRHGFTYLQP